MGFLVGAFLAVLLSPITVPDYPVEFSTLWPLLVGGDILHSGTILLANPVVLISIWLTVGVVISPFSTTRWNTIRTTIWLGVFVASTTLSSSLLQDASLWTGDRDARNLFLVMEFIVSLIVVQISLVTAVPLSEIIVRRRRGADPPIPEEIKTVCECGAVFSSKPILCAVCGRELNQGEGDS